MSTDATAMYTVEGSVARPTLLSQGPWDPRTQHGGAVAGLLTWAAERVPTLVPMRFARITVDLLRAIPMTELTLSASVQREGKRIQLVEATLRDGDVEVSRLTGLRIRLTDTDDPHVVSDGAALPELPPVPPSDVTPIRPGMRAGFIRGIDIWPHRDASRPQDRTWSWSRLLVPLVEGEQTSALASLMCIADFVSASASHLDMSRFTAINPDINVTILREPVGEWVGLRPLSWYAGDGIGHSRAELFDLHGFVATGVTTAVVDRSAAPWTKQ